MKISITAQEILDKGLWSQFCELTGTNEWAINEGLCDDDQIFELSKFDAYKLGLVNLTDSELNNYFNGIKEENYVTSTIYNNEGDSDRVFVLDSDDQEEMIRLMELLNYDKKLYKLDIMKNKFRYGGNPFIYFTKINDSFMIDIKNKI